MTPSACLPAAKEWSTRRTSCWTAIPLSAISTRKLMEKEPQVGGAWEWHQDYGYWYKNEFLFPDQMISIMIAITAAPTGQWLSAGDRRLA